MIIFEGQALADLKASTIATDPTWEYRDFVGEVEVYLSGRTEKILAVAGPVGTGKTVGVLQACDASDTAYILVQQNEPENGETYIQLLKETDKHCIVFNEYNWIRERRSLDYYLLTAVQNGKRIVLTGSDPYSLEMLNYGRLIHRIQPIRTALMTYEEYLRLNKMPDSKETYRQFLRTGGALGRYVITDYDSMKRYCDEAIVPGLAWFLHEDMSTERARVLAYAALHRTISTYPDFAKLESRQTDDDAGLEEFLKRMGVKTDIQPRRYEINRVADLFEQIKLVRKVEIDNEDDDSGPIVRYYLTNPSLTYQLVLCAYGLDDADDSATAFVDSVYRDVIMR